MVFNQNY